ncbi:carcinoembryonic antigen-related cell adhesion molecule 20-like [Branchiostoma floridae]|uniref:Carcinoembryonic antigen-related cell adhesion molecule 20-like n=1 Tax=Branchiostoma floridae TaxID=7739 RepID=A0A9J7MK04_BRAFL|nr:carcinoembryonic antigen-related cell adhesion molecule 20-like [Branchiostoma floridae]
MGRAATLPCTGITNVFREWQRFDADGTAVQLITLYTGGSTPDLQEKAGLNTFNLRGRFTATADDDFTATITNTRAIDDGRYQCDGSSSGGSVTHELLTYTVPVITGVAPSDTVTQAVDSSVTLRCDVTSKPTANVTWSHNGTLKNETGSVLVLSNIDYDDSGDYVCTAVNGYGTEATRTIQITVQPNAATGTGGLGTGAIVGIVLGVIAVVVIIVVLLVYFLIIKKSRMACCY